MGNRPDKSRAETGLQPADLRLTDGQDDAQRDFLDNLANGDRSLGQYEFVRAVQTDFLNVIRDTIAQLQLPTGNGGPRRTFLVDTHQKDQLYAFKLAGFLAENDVEVDFNHESHDPNLSLTKFERSVRQVQNQVSSLRSQLECWKNGIVE